MFQTCRGDLVESPYKFEDGIISQTQVKDEETSTTNFKNLIVVYATIPSSIFDNKVSPLYFKLTF